MKTGRPCNPSIKKWYLRSIELIRKYQPDIWWQDGNFHNLGAEMARMFVASRRFLIMQ